MPDSRPEGPLLVVRDLKIEGTVYPPGEKPRDVTIVDGVSFTLEKGKVLGLIGESGAGKSTIGLAAMAYGRGGVRITGGEVLLAGTDVLKLSRSGIRTVRGAKVAYVAQSAAAAFNPAKKLGEQVIEATLKHGKMGRAEALSRAKELFRVLGLPNAQSFGERYPHQVSGGQLQRAMTAMALCPKPALIAQVSDDIMVLRHGKTVEYGPVKQIIEAPQQDYTQRLVSVRKEQKPEEPDQSQSVLTIDHVDASYGNSVQVLFDVIVQVPP